VDGFKTDYINASYIDVSIKARFSGKNTGKEGQEK
jgi:protein tyrosine phosphatase